MSDVMWRYAIGAFLILHGIGHSGGYWFFRKSWLSPALTEGTLKWVFVVVWLIAMIGNIVAGIGLLQMHSWWRALAVAASVVSLIVSALYIQSPAFNAAAADVIILVALLVLQWPSAALVGS